MIGYIAADGKYHKGEDEPLPHDVNSQFKAWNHDNQRKRLNGDIIQPYINGEPNREFIEVYKGDVADRYFNQEVQDKTERNLGGI